MTPFPSVIFKVNLETLHISVESKSNCMMQIAITSGKSQILHRTRLGRGLVPQLIGVAGPRFATFQRSSEEVYCRGRAPRY